MILNELNQLLKESVTKVATENAIKLDQKILEKVEFEISAEQLRGDCLLYTSDAADES